MSVPGYLKIDQDGTILTQDCCGVDSLGSSAVDGHEEECMVQAVEHAIVFPIDPQSGNPTGRRVHRPIVITKVIDKSTPLLMRACCRSMAINAELTLCRVNSRGVQEPYYKYTFSDARIVQIETVMPDARDRSLESITPYERISIFYRDISEAHLIATTEESDSWENE